jgi:pyrroloquinoline quinone biosynthesis protein E
MSMSMSISAVPPVEPDRSVAPSGDPRPYTLVAELTYRCPLRCAYCSNPVRLAHLGPELATEDWARTFREAEGLGVVQVNLTGGEPLLRDDLAELCAAARACDLFTNLITSGIPLSRGRLRALAEAGLDAVQLSLQDTDPATAARIAGMDALEPKTLVAEWTRELGLPLTINVVLHRENLARLDALIAMAERLGADRLELAHVQVLGWALLNRGHLLPAADMMSQARRAIAEAKDRLRGRLEILSVLPDYFVDRPRACMDGWGRRYLVVAPDGRVLPCHAAHTLPGLELESVRDRSVAEIWFGSSAFNRFRGEGWMPEPCRSCDQRGVDFGGCRCQAFHLTGDAAATDPTCSLAPRHDLVVAARTSAAAATAVEVEVAPAADRGLVQLGTRHHLKLRRPPTTGA